jgi:hypothetical protein
MAIFKRKHNPFIANVTRSACGSGYIIPSTVDARLRTQENDDSVPLVALSDKEIEDLPEAAAAMMIYAYFTRSLISHSSMFSRHTPSAMKH